MTDLAERRGMETRVYQPAEDSRLLADVAVEALDRGDRVLDVGSGSGYVAVRVADEVGARVVASDLNPHACRRTRERARGAGVSVDVVRGDLCSPFADRAFDTVVCNPPYLPIDEPTRDDWMSVALSGGESGRLVVDPFVDNVGRVLRPGGVALLLCSTLTGTEAVRERARAAGLRSRVVAEESFPFETLVVLSLRHDG